MPRRPRRANRRLATRALDLSIAVPQVVAHRLARIAQAGATPSASDLAEIHRMGVEKFAAFGAAWQAMALAAMRAQQSYLRALSRAMLAPWWLAPPSPGAMARRAGAVAGNVLAAGIAPIRHKAVGNARRLGRKPRR